MIVATFNAVVATRTLQNGSGTSSYALLTEVKTAMLTRSKNTSFAKKGLRMKREAT
jgi:hypothetical protein